MEDGIEFYKEYGRLCGFSASKSAETKDDDHTIVSKYVVCNRSGFNEQKESISDGISNQVVLGKRRTVTSRCGCNAKLILKNVIGSSYRVSCFLEEHNHNLVLEDGRQVMRVNCEMSCTSRNFVFDVANVNIGSSKPFSLIKELVGSYANVGATVRDYRNFRRDLKKHVGERDARMIIDKYKAKKESCYSFYYAYDLDLEGHLTKLFWADSVSRRNYELYGDAVSFHATFDTNKYVPMSIYCILFFGDLMYSLLIFFVIYYKLFLPSFVYMFHSRYNMVFCPFTGIDKHEKCVTFAFVLLFKEDIPHFKWAFDEFLKAIGRNPVCIITDQCPSMRQTIPMSFSATEEFSATKHRLCMWHIMEKFPVKVLFYIQRVFYFNSTMKVILILN